MKYLTLLLCLCLLAGCQYKESPIKDYGVYVEIKNPEPEEIQEDTGMFIESEWDTCYGVSLTISGRELDWCKSVNAKHKVDIVINLDGEVKEMTYQEFKDRIFGNKRYLQRN